MDKKQANLLIVIMVLLITIFFILGIMIGKTIEVKKAKECFTDPFSFGIKVINDHSGENYICTCFSRPKGEIYFQFDSEGMINNNQILPEN